MTRGKTIRRMGAATAAASAIDPHNLRAGMVSVRNPATGAAMTLREIYEGECG